MDMGAVSTEAVPKGTYVDVFRIVCWQFLIYQQALRDISPDFDECPNYCHRFGKRKTVPLNEFCTGCDIKIARDSFETATEALLNERHENDWKAYGFSTLLQNVRDTYDMKEMETDNLFVTTQLMIDILAGEENRQLRIEDWNRREKAKADAR